MVDDPQYRNLHKAEKNYHDDRSQQPPSPQAPTPPVYLQAPPPQMSKKEYRDVKRQHESWEKLQESIDSMNDMLARKAELEQQEYERKKQNDELSLMDKVQLKNIIREYNSRTRKSTDGFHDDDIGEDQDENKLEIC